MTNRFVFEFHEYLDGIQSAPILTALCQDPVVWNALAMTGFGDLALDAWKIFQQNHAQAELPEELLPGDYAYDFWSPASLALLALDSPISLDNLRDEEFSTLDAELRMLANEALRQWLAEPDDSPGDSTELPGNNPLMILKSAGLIALALREQYGFYDNWDYLPALFSQPLANAATVAACLLGMAHHPASFLRQILIIQPELGAHALLSNPLSDQAKLALFDKATAELNGHSILYLIQEISRRTGVNHTSFSTLLRDQVSRLFAEESFQKQRTPKIIDQRLEAFLLPVQNSYQLANASLDTRQEAADGLPHYFEALRSTQKLAGHIHEQIARHLCASKSFYSIQAGDQIAASLQAWEQAIQLDPFEISYRARYAALLTSLDRLEEAGSILAEIDREESLGHTTSSSVLAGTRANFFFHLGDLVAAIQNLYMVVDLNGMGLEPEELCDLSVIAFELDNPVIAASLAEMALRTQPANPGALICRASAQLALENPEAAMIDAGLANELDPTPQSTGLLLQALYQAGKYEVALEKARYRDTSWEKKPEDWRFLAQCAVKTCDFEEARSSCQKALELNPNDGLAVEIMGQLALASNDNDSALIYFNEATQLSPDQALPWFSLANLYRQLDNRPACLEVLTNASRMIPDSAEIHLALGEELIARNAFSEAVQPLKRAASMVFTPVFKYQTLPRTKKLALRIADTLGTTLYNLGYYDEARTTFETILSPTMAPEGLNPQMAYNYAKTLASLNALDQAIPWFAYTVQTDAEKLDAKLDYARALLTVDDQEDLVEYLTLAIQLLQEILQHQPATSQDGGQVLQNDQKTTSLYSDYTHLIPLFAESYALLAESLFKAGAFDQSLQAYRQALDSTLIQQSSWRYRLSLGLGQTALKLDQPETAVAALLEARQINGRDIALHQALSSAYLALQLPADAYHAAVKAIRLSDEELSILIWFSDQCLQIARLQDSLVNYVESPLNQGVPAQKAALKALERAVNLAPHLGYLRVKLSQVQIYNQDLESAQHTLLELLPDDQMPSSPDNAYSIIHEVDVSSDDQSQAENSANSPLEVTIADFKQAAELSCQLGQPGIAAQFLEQALKQAPIEIPSEPEITQAELYDQLSKTYYLANNPQAGLRTIEQAIAIDGRPSFYRQKVAMLLLLNRLPEAQAILQTISSLEPDNPHIHIEIALVMYGLGKLNEALGEASLALDGFSTLDSVVLDHSLVLNRPVVFDRHEQLSSFSRWLCAELAHALLQDEMSLGFLSAVEWQDLPFESSCLAAELSLQDANLEKTAQAISGILDQPVNHPRTLLLQARLLARQEGLSGAAWDLFSNALELAYPGFSGNLAAQFDEEQIKQLFSLSQQSAPKLVENSVLTLAWHSEDTPGASNAPSPLKMAESDRIARPFYQEQVQKLIQIATQRSLECTAEELNQWQLAGIFSENHLLLAPDHPLAYVQRARYLARRAEKQSLYQDFQVITHAPGEHSLADPIWDEIDGLLSRARSCIENPDPAILSQVERWHSRAAIVFSKPTQPRVIAINQISPAPSSILDIEDLASFLRYLLDTGDISTAINYVQDQPSHPLLVLTLVTKITSTQPSLAIELVTKCIDRLTAPDLSLAEPLPMLYFALAQITSTHILRPGSINGQFANYANLANTSIQSALSIWPDEPRWHILAGEILLARCTIPEMETDSQPVENMSAGDLAQATADQDLEPQAARLYSTAVIQHFQQAILLEPGFAEHYMRLGHLQLKLGQVEQALASFTTATQVKPDLVEAWIEQSRLQKDLGLIEKAIYSAERALEYKSLSTEALLLRSELALMTNNPRGALSRAQVILKDNPGHIQAWYMLALAMESLNQPADALSALDKAIQYHRRQNADSIEKTFLDDDQSNDAIANAIPLDETYIQKFAPLRVRLIYALDGPQAAIETLGILLQEYPYEPHLNAMLASYSSEIGDYSRALQAAQIALANASETAQPLSQVEQVQLHYQIGTLSRQSGHLDQAIQHLNEAIRKSPSQNLRNDSSQFVEPIDAYLELGRTHQDRRQTAQAVEIYQMAARLAPQDYRPYYLAGLALKETKDYPEAEIMLRQAAHLAPNEVSIHRQLAAVVALNLVHNRRLVTPE